MTSKTAFKEAGRKSRKLPQRKLRELLTASGLASRRKADQWLDQGRLTVNDQPVRPWARVTARDCIKLDGKVLTLSDSPQVSRVLAYNKPAGELCARSDRSSLSLVFDRLPALTHGRWISVGRLDLNSSGLLLFTNDGFLANRLMHPSSGIDREYSVRVTGKVTPEMLDRLRKGVELEDGPARFSDIRFAGGRGVNTWYHVTLMSGRKNEVRRLWASQNIRVSRLKRVRFGPVVVPARLSSGRLMRLKPCEVAALYRLVSLSPVGFRFSNSRLAAELATSRLLIPYPGLP